MHLRNIWEMAKSISPFLKYFVFLEFKHIQKMQKEEIFTD